MADITYERTFEHINYRDGEDVVEAGGPNGFNQKFHAIEDEFDQLSNIFDVVDDELKNIPKPTRLKSDGLTLNQGDTSNEIPVETYPFDSSIDVERVYFAVIIPVSGPTFIQHTFLYRPAAGQLSVRIQFHNPNPQPVNFNYKVLTLMSQS